MIIIEVFIDFILYVLLAFLGFFTGEFILFIVTLGKRKVRWNYYKHIDDSLTWYILTEKSIWLGVVFWMLIIFFIIRN